MAKLPSVTFMGSKYFQTEEGKIVNESGKAQEGRYEELLKEEFATQQADKSEEAATKKQLPPPSSEPENKEQSTQKRAGPGFSFGAAARSVGKQAFKVMFPRLSGLMEQINKDIQDEYRNTQKLDSDMQLVTKELNETNNLLTELNNQMTKMLGLLGQIVSRGGVGGTSSTIGGRLASAFIGGLLGIAAAEAIPYISKWLSGGSKTADNITPPSIVPEPEVSENKTETPTKTAEVERVTPPVQMVSYQTDEDVANRTMAATREFETESPNIIKTYESMTEEQQARAGDLGSVLNTYRSNLAKKYGVKNFALKSSDYVRQEGQLKPNFTFDNNITPSTVTPENTISSKVSELKTTSQSAQRDLTIDAERITFTADGIMFNQTQTDEGDNQGYGGGGVGGLPGVGGGNRGFNPIAPPKLATVKSTSGASAQVAEQYKDRFQGLIDYLDKTNPGYIKVLGGYSNRANVNNPLVPSQHAFGAALDINPDENPNRSTKTTLPPEIGMVAHSFGLGWGMEWNSVKDPMHFSAAVNEGGTGDMFIPRSSSSSGVETPAETPANFVRPTISQGANLAKATSPAASVSPPSSAPSQSVTPVTSSPPDVNTQTGIPDKLKNPNIAGNVEPPDAHLMYPVWFGPALGIGHSTSMPAGVR